VICLIAVAVMSLASFLPYLQYPWTEGIYSFPSVGAPTGPAPTTSLAQGSDAFVVLVTLVVVGLVAAANLVGIRRRITGVASFGTALIAVATGASFPSTLVIGPPVIDYGFFVFVVAGTVAAIAGLVMVLMSFRDARPRNAPALRPTPT
jgi:hypothetical protein